MSERSPGPAASLEDLHRQLFELTLAYLRADNSREARRIYPRAMESARRAGDLSLQLHLLRLCRFFLEPGSARSHLEHAVDLARDKGLDLEQAFCLNNLATVCTELRLFEVAAGHLRACLEILGAHDPVFAAVPLNNLGFLAFLQEDFEGAESLFDEALGQGPANPIEFKIGSNLAAVNAICGEAVEAVLALKLLREEVICPPSILPAILFNRARALLEADRAEEALREAVVLPPWLGNDEPLARAALSSLRLQIYEKAGLPPAEMGLRQRAKLLEGSAPPQAWLYRTLWARGDIQFLEEGLALAAKSSTGFIASPYTLNLK
jgi:tetratricopeptide (TPR) repeat protein